MRLTLVDNQGTLATAAAECGWASEIEVLQHTDVRDVPLAAGTAFVSPANSLGFMDGGIDFVYSRLMFPQLEPCVKRAIADDAASTAGTSTAGTSTAGPHGCAVSRLGRPYLPVGRALVVPAPGAPGVSVVVAPTMLMPQDVRGTRNAYYAMRAACTAARAAGGVTRLVTPGLCTGCGMVPAIEAVTDMRDAYHDFLLEGTEQDRPWPATHDQIMQEQPHWYENTEFVDIPPESVKMH
jgi:O-acetyl-ADP-ribose deacetylase (regulator of RNase III)